MNKRKTLRMTSILLALMMFFGMVSVLLVPAGVAGAADTDGLVGLGLTGGVEVDQGKTAKVDSLNVLVKEYDATAPLQMKKSDVDAAFSDKSFVYDTLKLTLIDPNGDAVSGHIRQEMELKDGVYYYDVPIRNNTSTITGLYTVILIRYRTIDGMEYRELTEVRAGAYWLCELAKEGSSKDFEYDDNLITDYLLDKTTVDDADVDKTVNYNGPEAEIEVTIEALVSQTTTIGTADATKYTLRLVNPYTKTITQSKTGTTAAAASIADSAVYTVPKNAVHGRELRYGAMVRDNSTETSATKCVFIPASEEDAKDGINDIDEEDWNLVIVDTKAPTIDASAIKIAFGGVVPATLTTTAPAAYFTTPMAFSEVEDGYTIFKYMPNPTGAADLQGRIRVLQMKANPVTDANSGVAMNAANTNIYSELRLWKRGGGAATEFTTYQSNNTAVDIADNENILMQLRTDNSAEIIAGLKNSKLVFVTKDKVGNEATLETGLFEVVQKYNPIVQIDAVINEYKMQVGDTVLIADLAEQIRAEAIGLVSSEAPSYPNAYTIKQANDTGTTLDEYFDIVYDDDNLGIVSMTAKKAGTTRIAAFLTPLDIHKEMVSNHYTYPAHEYATTRTSPPYFAHYEEAMNPQNNNLYFSISEKDEYPVTSVTVAPKTLALEAGNTSQLTATVLPTNADDKTVEWYSSNTAVATVDANGLVTAVADGTCQIYARSNVLSGIQDHCEVTVGKTVDPDPVPEPKPDDGWKDEGNNRYYYIDGQKVVGWRKIEGSWYFFDYTSAAMRANGWLKEGGKWYYLNSNGTMKSAEWFKDNNGKWYWLKANGAMAAGWEKINGTWYYFNASGAMQTGWVNVRGIWYYMKSSGAMAEGWLQDGGSWYYLTPGGGAMVTGRVTINGRASNFATSGRWLGYV